MITTQKRNCAQKHRHCRPDCTSHGQFACSLRKYSSSSSTKHFHSRVQQTQAMTTYQQLITRKKSTATIKQFKQLPQQKFTDKRAVNNVQSSQKVAPFLFHEDQSQIQSLIDKVNLKPHQSSKYQNNSQSANQRTKTQILRGQKQQIKSQVNKTSKNVTESQSAKHDELVRVKSKEIQQLSSNVDRISKIIDMFNKKMKTESQELNQSVALRAQQHKNDSVEFLNQNYDFHQSSAYSHDKMHNPANLYDRSVNSVKFSSPNMQNPGIYSNAVYSSSLSVPSNPNKNMSNQKHANIHNSNSPQLVARTVEKRGDKQNNGHVKQDAIFENNKFQGSQLNYRMFNMNIKNNIMNHYSKRK